MKPYKIRELEKVKEFSNKPIHNNFDTEEWKEFIKLLVLNNPNGLIKKFNKRIPGFIIWLDMNYIGDSTSEKIFKYYNNSDGVLCMVCNIKTRFLGIKEGYRSYCSLKCSHLCDDLLAKRENTMIQKFGVKSPFESIEVKQKIKTTIIKKYGVENPFAAQEIKSKLKETWLSRFGVDNPAKNDQVKEKTKKTCLERYGGSPLSNPAIQEKSKKTCIDRYGCEYPMQNAEIFLKASKNAKKFKSFIFDSGRIAIIQGYEYIAIKHLLENHHESDIVISHDTNFKFQYEFDNKKRFYFPDIYVKSKNLIIEVKSEWTLSNKNTNSIPELEHKRLATISNGFDFEVWICDKNKILKKIKGEINDITAKI